MPPAGVETPLGIVSYLGVIALIKADLSLHLVGRLRPAGPLPPCWHVTTTACTGRRLHHRPSRASGETSPAATHSLLGTHPVQPATPPSPAAFCSSIWYHPTQCKDIECATLQCTSCEELACKISCVDASSNHTKLFKSTYTPSQDEKCRLCGMCPIC